jgi:hypothetical protein
MEITSIVLLYQEIILYAICNIKKQQPILRFSNKIRLRSQTPTPRSRPRPAPPRPQPCILQNSERTRNKNLSIVQEKKITQKILLLLLYEQQKNISKNNHLLHVITRRHTQQKT